MPYSAVLVGSVRTSAGTCQMMCEIVSPTRDNTVRYVSAFSHHRDPVRCMPTHQQMNRVSWLKHQHSRLYSVDSQFEFRKEHE